MSVQRIFTWILLIVGVLTIVNALTSGIWISTLSPVIGISAIIVQLLIGSLMVYYARKWLA